MSLRTKPVTREEILEAIRKLSKPAPPNSLFTESLRRKLIADLERRLVKCPSES